MYVFLFAFRFRKYRINLRFADFLLICDARPNNSKSLGFSACA